MTGKIIGGGANEERIRKAAFRAIKYCTWFRIPKRRLRDCILDHLAADTIIVEQCEDPTILAYNIGHYWYGLIKMWTDDEIHICINNIGDDDEKLWQAMLHEWAHACCWDHGEGGGIPGNDGSL